jgi:hypothetical protein
MNLASGRLMVTSCHSYGDTVARKPAEYCLRTLLGEETPKISFEDLENFVGSSFNDILETMNNQLPYWKCLGPLRNELSYKIVERNTRTLGPAKEGNYSDLLSNQQVVSNAVPSKVRMAKLKEQVQSLDTFQKVYLSRLSRRCWNPVKRTCHGT